MSSPPNITNITPPRVPIIDDRTGLISREWYRFFLSLFTLTGSGMNTTSLTDLQVGPPALQIEDVQQAIVAYDSLQPTQESAIDQIAELQKQIEALSVQTRDELGTMSQLQQSGFPWVTFDTTPEGVPPDVGTLAWDGGTTLGVQMTTDVLGRINESGYYYIKASSTITKGQVIMFTGAVGASGVPTGAPATGVTDGSYIMGVAAENIATNSFGLVQFIGTLRGVNTSAYADGDILWYNPAVTGGLTKTKPSAPNVKVQMAAVVSATNNGTILIRVSAGSELGGTDSNVQFGTLANKDFIQYDSALQYWKNVAPGALTKTDDTNVTLTLGGTPATALLAATSLTLGWTGQLAIGRGGTGVSTTPANGQLLIGNGTGYTVANLSAGSGVSISNSAGGISISATGTGGTVTSVGLSAPTGFSVSGSPVTSSGTLALAFATGYSLPTNASQTNWDTAYTERKQWDGGSTGLVAATGRTSLGATTVGSNLFTLTNPSAITFLRVNADNTVSALDAATFRTAIGAGTGSGTVTSVQASGGTTGLSFSGGPITTSGTLTLAGTLAASNGGTGLTALGTGIATWLGTPSSANLAAAVTDETGSGALVFATSPALVTPTIDGLTAGKGASTLSANTAFGVSALAAVTTGNGSTAIGYQALKSITTTGGTTAVGYQAGTSLVTGGVQTSLFGYVSGLNLTGSYNTAFGAYALQGTSGSATGQFNTAVGIAAGQVIQGGSNNALFGIYVGAALTSGNANAAFGGNASSNAAGSALTTGSSNSLFGNTAGGSISTGSKNSVFGNYTGNNGGLDIRTKSNYIVLSDGDGVPQQVINPQGTQEFSQGTGKFPKFEGFFGWQNVSSVTQDLATLFPDVTFTSGSISLVLQILSGSNTTNSGSTIYNVVRQTNGTWTSGSVSSVTGGVTVSSVTGSSTSITITFSGANQYGYCNVSGLVLT